MPIRPFPRSQACSGYTLPCGMPVKTLPRKYQQDGIKELIKHESFGLFDIPGLGKSLQLTYANMNLMYLDRIDCMIVVCRSSHRRVWQEEQLPTHAPHLSVHCMIGKDLEKRKKPWPMDKDVYIISYELLALALASEKEKGKPDVICINGTYVKGADIRNLYNLLRFRRCSLVLDESHAIKRWSSKKTQVLFALAPLAKRRYISTGTPAAERPEDVWSQMYFLDRGKTLGPVYEEFLPRFAVIRYAGKRPYVHRYKHLEQLQALLAPKYIRRTKLEGLPPKIVKPGVWLTPIGQQAKVIAEIRGILIDALLKEQQMGNTRVSLKPKGVFDRIFHKLNKAAACPWLEGGTKRESVKLNDLTDFIEEIGNEKIIVWCVNRSVAEHTAAWLKQKFRIETAYVHGGISDKDVDKNITAFKAGNAQVLCATMSKLREAETLTAAHYAYYLQFDWSLLNWMQSQKRIHRLGQDKTVIIRMGFVEGTFDHYLFQRWIQKEGASAKVTGDISKDYDIPIKDLLRELGYEEATQTTKKTRT